MSVYSWEELGQNEIFKIETRGSFSRKMAHLPFWFCTCLDSASMETEIWLIL
jgi:hypothetical protein